MNEEIKLDLKDRKILLELDRNARQSNSEIAKKVGLNKNTVNYKISRMVEEGLIQGYYAVIDSSKFGYFSVRVYAKFFNTNEKKENEILNWLKNNKFVGVVSRIDSNYDFGFMAYVKNIYEWENVLNDFKEKFREFFWQERVDIFCRVFHYTRTYLLDKNQDASRDIQTIGGEKIEKTDELDLKILSILAKNAKLPLIEIAEKLKADVRTIAFRIKQLEKRKIIQGYRVLLNLNKIGYEYYKLNIKLNDCSNYKKLFGFCENHKNVIYIDQTLGDLDFEIDIEVHGRQELLELIAEIKKNFPVRDIETLNFKEYLKLETLPQNF
jgi:DNA-binding Lrp family transcriptional regulator